MFSRMSPGLGVLVSPGWRPHTGNAEFGLCTSLPFLKLDRLFSRVLCITELPPAMCERNHFGGVLFFFYVCKQIEMQISIPILPPS